MKHIYLVDTDLDDVETAPPTSPRSIIVTTAPSSMWNTRHEYVNIKDVQPLLDALRYAAYYHGGNVLAVQSRTREVLENFEAKK